MRRVLLENPWPHPDIASLVAENEAGALIGFLGVVPRPMNVRGETVWMAVNTQLMADPDSPELVGVGLLQASLNGPLDMTFSDLSNDQSCAIWEGLGGLVAKLYSLYWTRPLKPARLAIQNWNSAATVTTRVVNRGLRPLASLADLYLANGAASVYSIPRPECVAKPIGASRLRELYARFLRYYAVTPEYSDGALEWLLADIKAQLGSDESLKMLEIQDAKERPLGWFVCVCRRGGGAQVLQLGGRPDRIDKVLASLFHEAAEGGALYISGRMQPEFLAHLGRAPISLSRHGPWVCASAKRQPVRDAILEGRSWLTRLEGEWWMNF